MKRFVIEGLNTIKELDGEINEGRFRHIETFKSENSDGLFRKFYEKDDHYESITEACEEIHRRRKEKIEELQADLKYFSDPATVVILNKKDSLHYANSHLRREPNFTYEAL